VLQPTDELQAETRSKQDLERLIEELSGDASAVVKQAKRLAGMEAARMRIAVESKIASTLTWTFVLIACGATGAFAGVKLLGGIAAGLADLTGRVWLGDLLAGLLVILLLGGGGRLFWMRRDKDKLAALKREFAERAA
jgi:hypothetical protein